MNNEEHYNDDRRRIKFTNNSKNYILWLTVFMGGMISACLLFLAGAHFGKYTEVQSFKSESPSNLNNQDPSSNLDSSAPSHNARNAGLPKIVYSVPDEYLESLAASRRICFIMKNGGNLSLAIKFTFYPSGILASGEMYEKNVPKPTQFSMDGLRVLGSIKKLKNDTPEELEKDVAKYVAVSLNKAYQDCQETFTESEIKSMKDYFAKYNIQ